MQITLTLLAALLTSVASFRLGPMKTSIATSKTVLFKKTNRLLKLIDGLQYDRSEANKPVSIQNDPMLPLVETVIKAADKRKAAFIDAFRVTQLTEVTQFMIIIEGNSKPQNQAIALSIEEDVQELFDTPTTRQGSAASGWILIDYGSVIVHIMTPQMRSFYKIEKRWKDAEFLDISYLLIPDGPNGDRANKSTSSADDEWALRQDDIEDGLQQDETEDPFWS